MGTPVSPGTTPDGVLPVAPDNVLAPDRVLAPDSVP